MPEVEKPLWFFWYDYCSPPDNVSWEAPGIAAWLSLKKPPAFLPPTSIIYFLFHLRDIGQFFGAQSVMLFEKQVNHATVWKQGRMMRLSASLLLLHECSLPLWFASKISPGNRYQQLQKYELKSWGVVALWSSCSVLSYRILLQGKHGLYLLDVYQMSP